MTSAAPARVALVVPCYNEAARLEVERFRESAELVPNCRFVFVDDGSTDDTERVLRRLCATDPEHFEFVSLPHNKGKAEAVRAGVLHAAASGPDYIGYWDADLATPLTELPRFVALLDDKPVVDIVLGARVNLLGRRVRRSLVRHYASRVFATAVATSLRLSVYDTQCGAKLFRARPDVVALFAEPFTTDWIFDVELLARAIDARGIDGVNRIADSVHELPLLEWSEVAGSSLRPRHALVAARDFVRIFGRHRVSLRFHRGSPGMTIRVALAVRRVLRAMSTDATRIGPFGRAWRVLATIPVFGVLFVWTRLRLWFSGPVGYEATTRQGTTFRCVLPDFVQTYLFLFGVWEPDITAFIEGRLAPDRTFVDVGANIGYHSLVADHATGGSSPIVAIEASPDIHLRLQESLAANGRSTAVRTVQAAANDHRGPVAIFQGPAHNTGLSTTVEQRGFEPEGRVSGAPLAELLTDDEIATAQLVKIDVEGGEGAVLAGMGSFLDRCPDDVEILLELSPRWWPDADVTPADLLGPLFDRGFHAYEVPNNLWPWRYLWPRATTPPTRSRRDWRRRPRRIDLVLSRVDAERLD